MVDWLEVFYSHIDGMRMEAFLDGFTDDAVLTFANNPRAVGREQIQAGIGGLWAAIGGLRHEIRERYDNGDRTIIETTVHYTRKDGIQVAIPCASALARDGDKVSELTIYMDLAPLFALAPATEVTPA